MPLFRLDPVENQEDCNEFVVYQGKDIVGWIKSERGHVGLVRYNDLVVTDDMSVPVARVGMVKDYEPYVRTASMDELESCCRALRKHMKAKNPYIFYISSRSE